MAVPVAPIAIGILSFLGSIGARLLGKGVAVVAKIEVWLWALIFISVGLSTVAYEFLYWALNPETIRLSYTKLDNPIIKAGFGITQSLVNMALVLVLIYVALAIALRLAKETEAKKLLAKFILVALLVNFAPVLCGLVVDAANIIMNEFTKPILASPLAAASFFEKSKAAIDTLGVVIEPGDFVLAIWVIIFNFLLALVFFMFGGILILRHLAIWVLVILAPLAFVCFVIPPTQQYWRLWRDQFLNWAFIGVPITFFLYLALFFTALVGPSIVAPLPNLDPSLSDLIIFSVPLLFLYLALQMGKKSTAWGVAASIGFGSALLKRGVAWGRAKGLPALKSGAKYAGQRALETPAVEAITRRLETTPLLGRVIGGPGATERRREERLKAAREAMEKIPDTPEGNKALMARITRRALTIKDREERIAAIETLAKRKELGDAVAPYLPEFQRLGGNVSLVYKARPDLAQYLIDPDTGQPRGVAGIDWAMERITPADFHSLVQKEALQNPRVVIRACLDERKFEQAARHMRIDLKREFINTFQTNPALKRGNLRAQGFSNDQIRQLIARARDLATDPRWRV